MLNRFEQWMLERLIAKVVRQECGHQKNITALYRTIYKRAKRTFYEDNKPTLDGFLDECFEDSKKF